MNRMSTRVSTRMTIPLNSNWQEQCAATCSAASACTDFAVKNPGGCYYGKDCTKTGALHPSGFQYFKKNPYAATTPEPTPEPTPAPAASTGASTPTEVRKAQADMLKTTFTFSMP